MFIKDMLKEELQNSVKIREDYKQAIQALPKGSIVRKRIGVNEYLYLAYRDGGKVRFDYVGKPDEEVLAKHQEAKALRKRYRKKISEVNDQIKFIRKVLRG
jgi:hypothetical protein